MFNPSFSFYNQISSHYSSTHQGNFTVIAGGQSCEEKREEAEVVNKISFCFLAILLRHPNYFSMIARLIAIPKLILLYTEILMSVQKRIFVTLSCTKFH